MIQTTFRILFGIASAAFLFFGFGVMQAGQEENSIVQMAIGGAIMFVGILFALAAAGSTKKASD